jgi:DNA-binding NarL/FixJ family response regulator
VKQPKPRKSTAAPGNADLPIGNDSNHYDLYHCATCGAEAIRTAGDAAIHGRPVHCGRPMDVDTAEELARIQAWLRDGAKDLPQNLDAENWADSDLSRTDRFVAYRLAMGQTYKGIGRALRLDAKTVKYHVLKVYAHMGVHDSTNLYRALRRANAITEADFMNWRET